MKLSLNHGWSHLIQLPCTMAIACAAASGAAANLAEMDGVAADTKRPGFVFKAAAPLVLADALRIPREVSPVCAFVVEDGPAAVDVAFNGGLRETGGACGFTKEGPGTMRVADTGPSRRETWKDLKYGIFSHYVWNGYGMTAGLPNADGSRAATIDGLADSFDVPDFVNQPVEAGVQYVVFTAILRPQ